MRISVTSSTYARTSLATSPLTEAAVSLRELAGLQSSPARRQQALRAVRDLDLQPLLVLFTRRDFAEILSPPPARSTPDFQAQLDALTTTPEEWLHRDILRLHGVAVPAAARDYMRTPLPALHRLAETLEKYWAAAIAPWWPRLSALLEQDLLYRAQTLTRHSLLAMLNGLHPELRATDDAVFCAPPWSSSMDELRIVAGRDGLVFVAGAFVHGKPLLNTEEWDRTAVHYQIRGTGNLDEAGGLPHSSDTLAVLLSHRRADLIRAVQTPSTPGELAHALGVTSSAVSQQLAQLLAAGLVSRKQLGRKAFYELTTNGHELLQLLDRTG